MISWCVVVAEVNRHRGVWCGVVLGKVICPCFRFKKFLFPENLVSRKSIGFWFSLLSLSSVCLFSLLGVHFDP